MADIAYVAGHPHIPRTLLGTLATKERSPLKLMVEVFVRRYEGRISGLIEEAQRYGEVRNTVDKESAARLFIATIQHLVFRALVADEIANIREAAPAAFTSYRRCVEAAR
ncbi:TetR family transcriptional regulator C-terminal domain-containing protein [Ciceribacter azotifigens]|uniref:TetR family transcriptional regulator C-terminal domain-containing protein n=1 Tax=Ciceribacter azotifigens TaxID=2069303 RepID=UPI003A8C3B6D